MKASIGIMSYLNNRPLVHHRPLPGCQIQTFNPSEALAAFRQPQMLAGIVPVAGLSMIHPYYELLGSYGIACNGDVLSVALFSKIPFHAFNAHHTVKLSAESKSSNRLLSLLLGYRGYFAQHPKITIQNHDADGELVIGDSALYRYHANRDQFITDLSGLWYQYTGHPFVFARWVVHKKAPASLKADLLNWLGSFNKQRYELNRLTAQLDHYRYRPLSKAQIIDYLDRIQCEITPDAQHSQNEFLNYLNESSGSSHRLWPDSFSLLPEAS